MTDSKSPSIKMLIWWDLIYLLSFIFPKNKKLWVFGAWFAEKYSDNSKYLFEHVNEHHPEIRAVWLTKNNETLKLVRAKGYEAHLKNSFQGYYLSLRARVGVVSTGPEDINHFTVARMKIVQLWHGIPFKKYGFANPEFIKKNKWINSRFHHLISPYLFHQFIKDNLYISTSVLTQKNRSITFNVPKERVKITGQPRTDVFFRKTTEKNRTIEIIREKKEKGLKIGIYMPTHRSEGESEFISNFLCNELDYINAELAELDVILLMKFHFYHLTESNKHNNQYSNVIFLNDRDFNQDIYPVLKETDFLVTDYSSVFLDYLLLDKPVIFSNFDYQNYLKTNTELFYDYQEITPGPKPENWHEVIKSIKNISEDEKTYRTKRNDIKETFHKFKDSGSSERVYNEIEKEIQIRT